MITIYTATSNFERIKRIKSHVGLSRFLATVEMTDLVIPRTDLPSPYRYSPTHVVYRTASGEVIFIVETAHKQYDIFRVRPEVTPTVEVE